MAPKGGPRRLPTPKIDMEHLVDVLKEQMRILGVSEAFQLKEYLNMQKSQAINGKALVSLKQFLNKLLALNESLLFNYKDLKEGFSQVIKDFPDLKMSFSIELRPILSGKLAEACMSMCTHMRRLRMEQKFVEACKNLSDWQAKELEELRAAVVDQGEPMLRSVKAAAAEEEEEEETASVATEELLARDIPSTPGKRKKNDLLEAALEESPVPARKQSLKMLHPLKKPAAKLMKKPSASVKKTQVKKTEENEKTSLDYKEKSLHLMPYRKTTAVAWVAKGVGQLFQRIWRRTPRQLKS